MKYVYVLSYDGKGTYLEQMLVSITSLKMQMHSSEIIIILDNNSKKYINKGNRILKSFQVEIKYVDIDCMEYNIVERSRILKTLMYNLINEDFLYIDSDTIICEDLSTIQNQNIDYIGMVKDYHYNYSEHPARDYFDINAKKCGYHPCYGNLHFNGGMMYVKKSQLSLGFFELWHNLYLQGLKNGVPADQASLNEANYRLKGVIKEMNGIWNCQLSNTACSAQYVYHAKILHYMASKSSVKMPYDLANEDILRSILSEDKENKSKLDNILHDPKSAFCSTKGYLCDIDDVVIIQSIFFGRLKNIYIHKKKVYNSFNRIARLLNYIDNHIIKKS